MRFHVNRIVMAEKGFKVDELKKQHHAERKLKKETEKKLKTLITLLEKPEDQRSTNDIK